MRKRGQFQIGFGMIFSIILIVAFLVVAFIAIKSFLGVSCSIETGNFLKDLDFEITRIWKGSGESSVKEFKVNGCDFDYVCLYDVDSDAGGQYGNFVNDFRIFTGDEGDHNVYFYPRKSSDVPSTLIEHVNMELPSNPLCFQKVNNIIKIRLSKNSNEALVSLS